MKSVWEKERYVVSYTNKNMEKDVEIIFDKNTTYNQVKDYVKELKEQNSTITYCGVKTGNIHRYFVRFE